MNYISIRWLLGCLLGLQAAAPYGFAQDKYELRSYQNSTTFSQVIGVNAKLEVIGTREVTEGPMTRMEAFFHNGKKEVKVPLLEGFTNVEVQALSDTGLVVGYCSRPVGSAGGSLRAFAWVSHTNKSISLQPLDGDRASHAQDISADGTLVTGYSNGPNPPGPRPCVWRWSAGRSEWVVRELPTILTDNPFVQASQVLIAPNGQRIVACITETRSEDFIYESCLVAWEEKEGRWVRNKISDEQPKLKDINDAGVMVGSISGNDRPRAIRIDLEGNIEHIELLPGDDSNMAYGINNAGTIVGYSDDPVGQEGGPRAFIWQAGQVSPLALRADSVDSAALAINQAGAIGGFLLRDTGEDAATNGFLWIPKK